MFRRAEILKENRGQKVRLLVFKIGTGFTAAAIAAVIPNLILNHIFSWNNAYAFQGWTIGLMVLLLMLVFYWAGIGGKEMNYKIGAAGLFLFLLLYSWWVIILPVNGWLMLLVNIIQTLLAAAFLIITANFGESNHLPLV